LDSSLSYQLKMQIISSLMYIDQVWKWVTWSIIIPNNKQQKKIVINNELDENTNNKNSF
jgi:hypothetical protein